MPSTSTITGYNVFSSGTLIRSAAVNTNFSVYRGHLIAVDPDTATLSDLTYDLGSEGYRWKRAHVQEYVFSHHSTPSAPISGQVKVYFKSDGLPYILNASGTEAGFGGFVSPLTTKGDLHGYTSTGDARVPVGTNGHVLTADSSATAGVSWKAASVTLAITTVTGTYTATGNEDVILANSSAAAFSIYMPTATGNVGKQLSVQKISADFNAVSLVGIGSETVDDTTTTTLNTKGETLNSFSNNTNWLRRSRDIPSVLTTYTPTISGFGTVSTQSFRWIRNGIYLHVEGYFTSGNSTATAASITLPTGLSIVPAGSKEIAFGIAYMATNSTGTDTPGSSRGPFPISFDSATSTQVYISKAVDSDDTFFRIQNGSDLAGVGTKNSVRFTVPILGWKG